MKNGRSIIKAAVVISVLATLFCVATLIRALIISAGLMLPIIQVIGSAAICAVCVFLLRSYPDAEDDDEDEDAEDDEENEDGEAKDDREPEKEPEKEEPLPDGEDEVEKAVEELFEKYHLDNFEDVDKKAE